MPAVVVAGGLAIAAVAVSVVLVLRSWTKTISATIMIEIGPRIEAASLVLKRVQLLEHLLLAKLLRAFRNAHVNGLDAVDAARWQPPLRTFKTSSRRGAVQRRPLIDIRILPLIHIPLK